MELAIYPRRHDFKEDMIGRIGLQCFQHEICGGCDIISKMDSEISWEAYYTRKISETLYISVIPLTFGRARIILCDQKSIFDNW